ncbi:Myb-like DNA-binding domain containing protein [Tritrichomonas foetus]|uniref:Myb-like DNA-binding domain containing protein n=1 Tax=Tritrichomonas foetus TaxID=1144522 RepID=A0A1J4KYY3_9EUKA|nr:Myb-like DNA-binding domain containing protein [Tritrichomonas foetus]|eukprot:OHT14908.1 Myb-like DNA-binding domain containing protein [Tritrichomonas foetus]
MTSFLLPIIRKPLPTPQLESPQQNFFASKKKRSRGLRRKFSSDEDRLLRALVAELGEESWPQVSERMKTRSPRQCRERYRNYLADRLTNGPWDQSEEELLEEKVLKYGPRWTLISSFFPTRSDANVKNHWAFITNQRKKAALQSLGKENNSENIDSYQLQKSPEKGQHSTISNDGVIQNDVEIADFLPGLIPNCDFTQMDSISEIHLNEGYDDVSLQFDEISGQILNNLTSEGFQCGKNSEYHLWETTFEESQNNDSGYLSFIY